MGNPIQYHNTDNPSQMGEGLATTVGGFVTTTYHCENPPGSFTTGKPLWYAPLGLPQGGGRNENFTPAVTQFPKIKRILQCYQHFHSDSHSSSLLTSTHPPSRRLKHAVDLFQMQHQFPVFCVADRTMHYRMLNLPE